MDEKHHDSLKQYVNDVIGMERDIVNAVRLQEDDENVAYYPELRKVLREITAGGEKRIELFKPLSEQEGGSFGAVLKEGITAVTGALAGAYGKAREHPVSRMVRDDIIAMDVAAISYSMLYTLALAVGHHQCAGLAAEGLEAAPPLVIKLTDMLPAIICAELAKDAPLGEPEAAQVVVAKIRSAWRRGS